MQGQLTAIGVCRSLLWVTRHWVGMVSRENNIQRPEPRHLPLQKKVGIVEHTRRKLHERETKRYALIDLDLGGITNGGGG